MSEEMTLFDDLASIKNAKTAEIVDISDLELDFEYTPAEIKIKHKTEFEQALKMYKAKYDGYVVTAETFEADAKVRAKLNKLEKNAKNIIKDKLSEYSKPLDDVKKWIDDLLNPIKEIRDDIDKGVKEFEEAERLKRAKTIKDTFAETIKESGIDIDIRIFTESFDNFSKKKYFMADNIKVNTDTKQTIKDMVAEEVAKKQEHEQALIKISDAAAKANFGAVSYIKQFENGASLADILQAIADDLALAEKVREEERRKSELTKRIEEMTVLASTRGLDPKKYQKLLETGAPASEVHSVLMDDFHEMESQKEQDAERVQIQTRTPRNERLDNGVDNYATQQQNVSETKLEGNFDVTKWQGDFKLTFPDAATAKLFGGKGGLYEQHKVVVEKLGEWVKLD
ncbi:DUF1351 domain-containing protein [Streptococcus sp. FT1-55]|uniref:DUF1351 domain-containing protein n=1 Tax=Streptococcus sp. FT1-55 TaxID=3409805 RepID=UPI003BF5D47D